MASAKLIDSQNCTEYARRLASTVLDLFVVGRISVDRNAGHFNELGFVLYLTGFCLLRVCCVRSTQTTIYSQTKQKPKFTHARLTMKSYFAHRMLSKRFPSQCWCQNRLIWLAINNGIRHCASFNAAGVYAASVARLFLSLRAKRCASHPISAFPFSIFHSERFFCAAR